MIETAAPYAWEAVLITIGLGVAGVVVWGIGYMIYNHLFGWRPPE